MGKTTLVIMAAGMGSRFGGIKQIEPVGPNGEIILDYSVYDAIHAGFDKVIVIVRRDIEEEFRQVIGKRLEKYVETDYVVQDMEMLPEGFEKPPGRTKPWGTGHAVLCCKGKLNTPFAVINADDYYGKEGFVKLHGFLSSIKPGGERQEYCMAGFRLGNTLSDNGSVTRGVCLVEDGRLVDIEETQDIKRGGCVAVTPLKTIPFDTPVSMNMWGFTPEFLDELERGFPQFLRNIKEGDLKAEYLLPTIVGTMVKENKAVVHVLDTRDSWFGVTYKEDKTYVMDAFQKLTQKGVYPERLFE